MKIPASPFPGPVPLTNQDHIFGRARETAELIDRLTSDRFVLLYAPSGAGKSSLINAGLQPVIKERGFVTHNAIRVGLDTPKDFNRPKGFNRYVWSCVTSLELPITENRRLAQYLPDPAKKEFLFFDQFEEILTADPLDETNRVEFFEQLGEALRVRGRYAVFALREDYLAPLQQYLDWLPTQLSSSMRLNILSAKEARSAMIDSVATTKTVTLDEDVADSLVRDLSAGGWVEPVQLQVVCKRLWNVLPDGTTAITVTLIKQAGEKGFSTENALEGYYGDVVKSVATEMAVPERTIRDWFGESLISATGTRMQIVRATEKTGTLPNTTVDALDKAHLVRSDVRCNVTWTEMTHDRLIQPVMESNRIWKETNLSLLQREAELWVKMGSSPDRLLRGKSLKEAKKWARGHQADVNGQEKDYLNRSRGAARGRLLGRLAVVAFCLAVAFGGIKTVEQSLTSKFSEAKQASQETIRTVPDQPDLGAEMALGAVSALGEKTLFFRLFSWLASDEELEQATSTVYGALLAAGAQHDPRFVATIDTKAEADCIWFNPDGMTVSFLADHPSDPQNSRMTFDLRTHRRAFGQTPGPAPVRCRPADMLSGKSYREDLPPGWRVLSQPDKFEIHAPSVTVPYLVSFPAGNPWKMTVDPTGQRVAWITGHDNYVYLYTFQSRHLTSLPAGDLQADAVQFSPNGKLLAAAGRDQIVRLWHLSGAEQNGEWRDAPVAADPLHEHTDTIMDLAFSPDGRTLVSAGADRMLVEWRLPPEPDFRANRMPDLVAFLPGLHVLVAEKDNGEFDLTVNGGRAISFGDLQPGRVVLRADGNAAAVTHIINGTWEVFDLKTGKSLATPPAELPVAERIALSDDGQRVAVTSNHAIYLLSLESPARIISRTTPSPDDMRASVSRIVFLPGSHNVVTGNDRNEIQLWRSSAGTIQQPDSFEPTRQTVMDLAASPDGRLLAALDEERNLKFWSVAHGSSVGGVLKIPGEPLHIAFAKDSKSLEILMPGDQVMVLPVDRQRLYERVCLLAGKDPAFCAEDARSQK